MQATKNKPRCLSDCIEHLFQLKNNNGNNKHDVTVTFCPKFRRDPHPPQKTIPQYNLDNRYYTHAFVLGTEKKVIAHNHQQELMSFQTQIKDACEKNNQIFFPKPNEKNSYCSVCKEHFKNYYEHIRTNDHKIKIDAAIYNTEIKKLCDFYKIRWNGAHAKADEIVNEIYKQRQQMQKGISGGDDDQQGQEQGQSDEYQQQQQQEDGEDGDEGDKQNGEDQQQQDSKNQKNDEEEDNVCEDGDGNILQQKINSQMGESENGSKRKTNSTFFESSSELVVYLKKNRNGKYQIVRDTSKYQKQSNQKQNRQQDYQEQERKIKEPPKTRKIHKIKLPNREREQSSQYKASSSYEYDQQKGLCQNLKEYNRIRTRKQRKQQDQNREFDSISKEKSDPLVQGVSRQRSDRISKQILKQKSGRITRNEEQETTNKQNPYNMAQNYPNHQLNHNRGYPAPGHPHQNGYPPPSYHPSQQTGAKQGNRVGPPPQYMGGPPAMMYPSYYQNVMNYNTPMRNDPSAKNDDKIKKQRNPPYHPMYYNPWGYVMPPPPPAAMMRPDSNIQQARQQMPPHNPGQYPMMQNPNSATKPPQNAMNPKMNMYMPYPIDPRYMSYQMPPQYMPKKGQQPPRQSR